MAAARLAALAIRGLGGFDLRPLGGVAPAALRSVPGNARLLWQSLVLLFGANQPGTPRTPQTVTAHPVLVGLADLHMAGLVLAAARAWRRASPLSPARRADRVTAALVNAAVALIVSAGLFSTLLRSLSNAHEVAVLLPFGAALAGRTLPALPGAVRASRPLAVALTCWLAAGLAGLGYAATWPAAALPQQTVA